MFANADGRVNQFTKSIFIEKAANNDDKKRRLQFIVGNRCTKCRNVVSSDVFDFGNTLGF